MEIWAVVNETGAWGSKHREITSSCNSYSVTSLLKMQLGTGGKLDHTKDCNFINRMQLLAGSLKNFHIQSPVDGTHMARCTAREDREHVHTEKT